MSQSPEASQRAEILAAQAAKAAIIVDMDNVPTLDLLASLVKGLCDIVGFFRVGSVLCTQFGAPLAVGTIEDSGGKAFLDLKYLDDPETVGKAVSQAAKLGVDLISVHAAGGLEMLQAAVQNQGKSRVLAAMPSLVSQKSAQVYGKYTEAVTLNLSGLASDAKCDGIICQPDVLPRVHHLTTLKAATGIETGMASDGRSLSSPFGAIKAGANFLIIDRTPAAPHVVGGGSKERFRAIVREIQAAQSLQRV